jgi:murein DD-endopeptidase MepM/ murein hydrolase activator NlpD
MQVGWPGLSRAIAATIVLTSAFWIVLGIWLFRGHVAAERQGNLPSAASSLTAAQGLRSTQQGPPAGQPRVDAPARWAQSAIGPSGLRIPVAGVAPAQLVDTFAQARAQGARRHDAIDILAPDGTPVLAAAGGTVEKLHPSHDGGNTIYVRSPDRRLIFYYAHLSAYARDLREGMAVRSGQFLGTVGHSGNASPQAPHLHFAMWVADPAQGWSQDAPAVDPYRYLTGKLGAGAGAAPAN